ncbi:MAG: protein-glutamate O-methyltransferase CheR [Acidobacteria bacterium]|nr:protein-glutamate O-methyltransferase CheR [Acidobacteriota bacterium]
MNTLNRATPSAVADLKTGAKKAPGGIRPEDYRYLQDCVYRETGIVLDQDKHYLMDSRLGPIVRRAGFSTVADLCNLLRGVGVASSRDQHDKIKREVVNAMTTNETLFFRELAQYDALRHKIIPALMAERRGLRRLRFWSAAASTGQEAYSLAVLLADIRVEGWNVQITGTDINDAVLARARAGRYQQIEVNRGLPANYLVRYFSRQGPVWELKDEIKKMVNFELLDLGESLRTRGPYDIVCCRNVLIYFDIETKCKILSEI